MQYAHARKLKPPFTKSLDPPLDTCQQTFRRRQDISRCWSESPSAPLDTIHHICHYKTLSPVDICRSVGLHEMKQTIITSWNLAFIQHPSLLPLILIAHAASHVCTTCVQLSCCCIYFVRFTRWVLVDFESDLSE